MSRRSSFHGNRVIHLVDDMPDDDITEIHGIPCTTAIRTIIDLAPDVSEGDLRSMIMNALSRGLFTVDEAWARLKRPDMEHIRGAELVAASLRRVR